MDENVPFQIACVADALNLLYGLYKWFRRVRGPATTQATFQKAITDTGLSARDISKSIWINVTWPGANFAARATGWRPLGRVIRKREGFEIGKKKRRTKREDRLETA